MAEELAVRDAAAEGSGHASLAPPEPPVREPVPLVMPEGDDWETIEARAEASWEACSPAWVRIQFGRLSDELDADLERAWAAILAIGRPLGQLRERAPLEPLPAPVIRLSTPQPLPEKRRWWHGNRRREAERAAAEPLDQEPPTSDDIRPIAERGRHALGRSAQTPAPGAATAPEDRQDDDTLLPGQVQPITDDAADAVQRAASESLVRSGASARDVEELSQPGDGRDAAPEADDDPGESDRSAA